MKFFDKNKVVGRLEIIKVDSRTGKEEVIFDEHNVITEGMGMNLTELMTRAGCDIDPCDQKYSYKKFDFDDPKAKLIEGVHYTFTEEDE